MKVFILVVSSPTAFSPLIRAFKTKAKANRYFERLLNDTLPTDEEEAYEWFEQNGELVSHKVHEQELM